jgi:hypothetical protein
MAALPSHPLPQSSFPIATPSSGVPTQPFAQWLADVDTAVRQLAAALVGSPTQLVNAPNDTAAATAGVKVGQLYRTGSAVQIRVK